MPIPLMWKWILFFVFNGVLGAGTMMLIKGSFPNGRKASPILSTTIFTLGMTGLLVFGEPEMLQATIALFTGK